MVLRATSMLRAGEVKATPFDLVVLTAEQRHLRRKLITLQHGDEVLVDLLQTVRLADRDCLVLDDGRLAEVIAAAEELMQVTARSSTHLAQLAWHIGNRHLECQIEATRLLIRPDHVIAKMLERLGATVTARREPFSPEHGAYSHSHATPGDFTLAP